MGVYEYSNGGDGGGLVPRRRIRAFLVAGVFLFLVFAMLQIFMLEVRSSSVGRLVEDDLSSPPHVILRSLNNITNSFEPEYIFSHHLGSGYEGQADIYTSATTHQSVVVKTFWVTTRTAPVPPAVITRLQREHNVTVSIWPADISSTLRRYNRDHTGQEVTIHAIDLFYVPPADPLPPKASYPWRLVLPLKIGSLDSTLSVLPALNISVSDIDFLYRPRYHSVIEALALMHTTADPALNATGFCHDDIKLDNIFLRNSTHEMFLGDMGQTRPLVHRWHKGWRDCRLVDAHRAWKSYLQLLREGSARDAEFDVLLMAREVDWARAYWGWVGMKEPTLPQEQLVKGFWGLPPVQTSMMFPVFREGRVVRVEMGREEAIAELERLRREILRYNKTASVGVRPWWWWDVPGLPTGGHHDVVNKELKVIIHEGGRLVGMPGT